MSGATRQHYALACGEGLEKAATGPKTTPKFARGGKVDAKKVHAMRVKKSQHR